jgi:hypothetical protein
MQDSKSISATPGDLGFTYSKRKNGDVEVRHHGKLASTLRGAEAQEFLGEAQEGSFEEVQQILARVTGNYKHGNERTASSHPRNRR